MLSEAIEYPLEGDDALERFLLGGVLFLLSPVVVPGILLGGYTVAVVRAVMAGRPEPPGFDDWGDLFRDGLSVLAISLVYWLPGLVLTGLGLGVFVIASVLGFGGGLAAAASALLLGVVSIVGAAYGLAVSYLLPAAIVNFARSDELAAAWDTDALRTIVTDGEYATAWVAGTAVVLVVDSIGVALAPFLVGFVVFYFGQVAGTYLYTRGVMAALDVEPEPPTPPSSPDEGAGEGDASEGGVTSAGAAAGDDVDGTSDGVASTAAGEEADGGETGTGDGDGRALADVAGVGPATAESLRDAGFASVTDLQAASREDLADVDGIGPATADQIKRDV